MTFSPVLPATGYAGWVVLKKTITTQKATFNKSPEIKRDEDYFRANIGKVKTADQLIADRRLLSVALGAFGLDADIDNKAFIQKVLTDGTLSTTALANKLSDKQYLKFSAAFGFGDYATPSTQISDFADEIVTAFEARQFESAVGAQDGDLRLALNTQREMAVLAGKSSSETVKWYSVLGNTALKTVFTKALGLPSSVGSLDLDRQLELFKTKADAIFGSDSISQFNDPNKVEALIRRYLVLSQLGNVSSATSSGSAALSMLQQAASFARQR